MKTPDLKKITKSLEKTLDSKRFSHTLGVEYTAAALAMRYGESVKKAQLAGLLHDCAKCMSDDKKLAICNKHNIQISEVEKNNPFLLHAKVGGFIAMKEYDVEDEDVINAILNHTTGRPGMSLLEKIIYIADYIEPGRKEIEGLNKIRQMAFIDLDQALITTLEHILNYLDQEGKEVDPLTKKTYDYYCKEKSEM